MPRVTYATLEGRERAAAFKKFLNKKGFGVKPKRDKHGKRIIGPNHVSKIMKRRAAEARRNKEIHEEINRKYWERRQAEERAELCERIFFGNVTPKMKYEQARAEEVRKHKEECARIQREMPYKVWISQYLGDKYIARFYDTRANKIRLAWKLKKRRLVKKKSRRVTWNDIPEIVEFLNGENDYFNIVKIIK